jgi:hypothetical protein
MSRSSQPSSGPSAEAGAAGLSPRPTLRWFRRSSPLPDPGRVLRRTASGFPSASHRVAPLRERNIATTDASLQAESLVRFRELFQVFATAQSSQKPHKKRRRTRPPFRGDTRRALASIEGGARACEPGTREPARVWSAESYREPVPSRVRGLTFPPASLRSAVPPEGRTGCGEPVPNRARRLALPPASLRSAVPPEGRTGGR